MHKKFSKLPLKSVQVATWLGCFSCIHMLGLQSWVYVAFAYCQASMYPSQAEVRGRQQFPLRHDVFLKSHLIRLSIGFLGPVTDVNTGVTWCLWSYCFYYIAWLRTLLGKKGNWEENRAFLGSLGIISPTRKICMCQHTC